MTHDNSGIITITRTIVVDEDIELQTPAAVTWGADDPPN
jgi:hypothetical protein